MGSICSSEKKQGKYTIEEPKKTNTPAVVANNTVPKLTVGASEPLKFKVYLEAIKARSIPLNSCYVKVIFANDKKFTTSRETVYSENYSWVLKEEFEFNTTRGGLRESFIELILADGYDQDIGRLNVNLYEIAKGPPEQDFPLTMVKGNKQGARLNFAVKMFQVIHMSVRTKKITCKLNEGLKEKEYNFSLQLKTKGREFSSDHSINFRNPAAPAVAERIAETVDFEQDMDEENRINLRHVVPNTINKFDIKATAEKSQIDTVDSSAVHENPLVSSASDRKAVLNPQTGQSSKERTKTVPPSNLKKDILWEFQETSQNAGPILEMDVSVKELVNGTFQFFLWTNKESQNDNDSDGEVYIDHKLIAECYIGMNKFFFGQAEINFGEDDTGIPGQEQAPPIDKSKQKRIAKFNEKLFFHGAGIGDLVAEFILENSGFYRQMLYGVRNEEGVQKIGSMYMSKESSALTLVKAPDLKEIKALETYKENYKKLLSEIDNPKLIPKTRNTLLSDMKDSLYKILENLKSLNQDLAVAIAYKSPDTLLTSQKILLSVSRTLIDNAEHTPISMRAVCYENLTYLVQREEFSLDFLVVGDNISVNTMKLPERQESKMMGGPKNEQKLAQRKLEISQDFQTLLYLLLQKTIGRINDKGLPEKEKEFIGQFNIQAYFKIPKFRTKLLECFTKGDEQMVINEWRGTDWGLEEKADEKKKQQYATIFDWDKNFYAYLNETEAGKNNEQLLMKIMNDTEWQSKMTKQSGAFYAFINDWVKQVEKTYVARDNVPWQDIPGYITIIKSLFTDLKTLDVRQYPETLIQASCSLLKNEKLVNTFISIVYRKTRIYDSSNVFAVFELVNKWFAAIIEQNKPIPTTFDFGFFFKGLYMVLEGEHALNVALTLLVIYNNFNLFPCNHNYLSLLTLQDSEKQLLSEYVFGKLFFRLFLHWSWIVRQVFHHLLLYRFYHQHRYTNTDLKDLNDLKRELLQYNQKRESHNKTKKLLINDFINMEYARNMTIIENAYNKYTEEKKQQELQRKLKTKLKPLPKLKFASSINLGGFLKPEDLQPDSTVNDSSAVKHPADDFEISGNNDKLKVTKEALGANVDPSCWVINPDKLDVPGDKVDIKPGRSESVSVMQGVVTADEPASGVVKGGLSAKDPKDQGAEKYERVNDKKKVIHRRFMYFDKQTNEMKEIPKEHLVYLQASFQEFEKTKENYVKWLNQGIAKAKEEEARGGKYSHKVPELIVKIPLDDLDAGQSSPKDW